MTVVLYLYQTRRSARHFGYAAAVGRRPLRVHLHAHADPAAPVREGRGRPDGARAASDAPTSPSASSHWRPRVATACARAFPAASAPSVRTRRPTRDAHRVALLFFVPFLWSVSTSFKTLPDSGQGFSLLPQPLDDCRLPRRLLTEYHFGRYTVNSASSPSRSRSRTSSSPRSAATRSRGCASRGARCSSCSCSATLMIPDQLRLVPIYQMLVDCSELSHWHLIATLLTAYILINLVSADEPLPDAPVLPDDPEGLRGGGEARRRGLLQDVLARDAAARRARARRGHDPDVPGHVERLLLAADPAPGRRRSYTVHARARAASAPATQTHGRADGRERDRDPAGPRSSSSSSSATSSPASRRPGSRDEPARARSASRCATSTSSPGGWSLLNARSLAVGRSSVVAGARDCARALLLVVAARARSRLRSCTARSRSSQTEELRLCEARRGPAAALAARARARRASWPSLRALGAIAFRSTPAGALGVAARRRRRSTCSWPSRSSSSRSGRSRSPSARARLRAVAAGRGARVGRRAPADSLGLGARSAARQRRRRRRGDPAVPDPHDRILVPRRRAFRAAAEPTREV